MHRVMGSIAGALSSVCIVTGILLLVGEELDRSSDAEVVSHFAGSGDRYADLAGTMLMMAGAALYLCFLSALRSRLTSETPGLWSHAWLVGAAGSSAASLLVVASCLLGATAIAVQSSTRFSVDPNLARLTVSAGATALFGWVAINCVTVAAASVAILRTASLPIWLAWVGFAVIPLALLETMLFPVFMLPLWVLVTSFAMTRQTGPEGPLAA